MKNRILLALLFLALMPAMLAAAALAAPVIVPLGLVLLVLDHRDQKSEGQRRSTVLLSDEQQERVTTTTMNTAQSDASSPPEPQSAAATDTDFATFQSDLRSYAAIYYQVSFSGDEILKLHKILRGVR